MESTYRLHSHSHILTMSTHYDISFRLDGTDYTLLKEFLKKDGGAYFVVSELEHSNPHCHGYIHTTKKIHSFRMQFKRAVIPDSTGNGAYSVTAVRDVDKYYRYMCKGDAKEVMPVVVCKEGVLFSDQWVRDRHDAYWTCNDELMAGRAKMKTWEAVLQACTDAKIDWRSKEEIAKVYIREVAARNGALNVFSIRSNVQLIQVKLCPDDTAVCDLAATVAGQ